jgi:hypothetical protein
MPPQWSLVEIDVFYMQMNLDSIKFSLAIEVMAMSLGDARGLSSIGHGSNPRQTRVCFRPAQTQEAAHASAQQIQAHASRNGFSEEQVRSCVARSFLDIHKWSGI